jgi:hypothetical protein
MRGNCQVCGKDMGELDFPNNTSHMQCVLDSTAHVRVRDLYRRACRVALQRRKQAYMRRLGQRLLSGSP